MVPPVRTMGRWIRASACFLHGVTPNWSLFLTDTLTVAKSLNLTVSGRFNRFTIDNSDRIDPVAGPGSLDGTYVYQRFNPAIGLTWSPTCHGSTCMAVIPKAAARLLPSSSDAPIPITPAACPMRSPAIRRCSRW